MGTIGRVLSFAFEATLVSTALAGAMRTAGVSVNEKKIEPEALRGVVSAYFGVGDWVLDTTAKQIKNYPDYFKRR
ncbi:hypothetical protein BCR33DRAFT_663743 [Rhizoclosmatium globosum]|uniref:Uncharacterized protein n=1 Tax=Rhizoclosmatium globosum TaxID=329046 RepID=A0A1Y2BQY7_9FUNG|nr:hypothetical protein BCR33DRAFT_663743 [Rhizoclosmatium globosum]|eukprot:ORY37037.1 hypothetical protein BCR33DRAFT_663743 [Rhizoclosmatium globosum]